MKTQLLIATAIFSFNLFAKVSLVTQTDNYIELTVTTEIPTVTNENGISRIQFPDWQNGGEVGDFELPIERTVVALPIGKRGQLKIESVKYSALQSLKHPLAKIKAHGKETRVRDRKPKHGFVMSLPGQAEGDNLLLLHSHPIKYYVAKNKFNYITEAKIKITFIKDTPFQHPVMQSTNSGSVVKWLSINSNFEVSQTNRKPIDLVISHKNYEATLKVYLDKKRAMGREVKDYYVSNTTTNSVKKIIDTEYLGATPPSTTLLVGSIIQIPSYSGSGENYWTDYNYSLLPGDTMPDIALGRIPAQSDAELKNIINKLLEREIESHKYKDILLTAGQDTSMGCPANVTLVGQKLKQSFTNAEIIKKYRTEVSTEAVIDAYNNEPNVIFYDGHGNRTSMSEVPLSISSMNQLTNLKSYLIFDIACLNANWSTSGPQSRNFAESILFRENSGAAGILASGGSGWGHEFFQTIGELMGKAKLNQTPDPELNQVGRIILLAKIKHGSQDRTYWNYYGDPATSVWESTWGK